MVSPWERVHARHKLVADVLSDVERSGDAAVVERWRQRIEQGFGDLGGFLLHLQRRWYTRLQTRLDAAMDDTPNADLNALAPQVWADMAVDDPTARRVLDAYADHPGLQANEARLRRMLGFAADIDRSRQACAS